MYGGMTSAVMKLFGAQLHWNAASSDFTAVLQSLRAS